MLRERTRCCRRLLVGLTAAALLLSLPATGLAAERENQSAQLAKAGLLARGAGYGTDAGSKAVRQLQLQLRTRGDRPGPIDGLYGPRTEAAVVRFQRSHGLAVDGVVGPQTKGRLLAQRAEQRPARAPSQPTQTSKPERKSPAPDPRTESAPEPEPVRPSAGVGIGRAEPESSSGLPPLLVAIGAALVVASLLLTLRSRRREAIEARLNLGLVCAALIAAGVLGAAIGALFATQATPDDDDRTTADSGALLASQTGSAEPATRTPAKTEPATRTPARTRTAATARASAATGRADAARRSRAKRTRSGAGSASTVRAQVSPSAPAPPAAPEPAAPAAPEPAAPAPGPAAPATGPAPAPAPPTAPGRAPAPAVPVEGPADERDAEAVIYTVRPGDALWPIARDHLAPNSSDNEVARKVGDLKELNIENRIQSGDPDVIVTGEKLRIR